jgi:NAD(P)H-hydrate epimerase
MSKILSVEEIRKADQFTIANEPIKSIDLMERAAWACTNWLIEKLKQEDKVLIFAGPGNNGGDGLAIARQLVEKGYQVQVVMPWITDRLSADCQLNLDRLNEHDSCQVLKLLDSENLKGISESNIVVDALFGSGLTRSVDGIAADCIDYINKGEHVVISVDIPSGLFADQPNQIMKDAIVQADYTLSLEMAKHSFMMPDNELFVGELHILPIGLSQEFILGAPTVALLLTKQGLAELRRPRAKHSHKGTFGHGLLIAGSYGKMGAAILAAKACLRSGVGLCTLHIPKHANPILQTALPEAMLSMDDNLDRFSQLPSDLSNYDAIAIGPGLGTDPDSQKAFKFLIQESQKPLVIDADALNILSENKTYLGFLPANSILTPHPKEFERLVGKCANGFERIQKQRELAQRYNLYVILKGAYTSVATPNGQLFYNTTGNPGMATGGSGDVLTGVLLALMAQGYPSFQASLLAVYLHGMAGDLALELESMESLIASDLIANLGKAFKQLG